MPSVKQAIEWDESAEELYERYLSARDVEEQKRLHRSNGCLGAISDQSA